MQKRKRGFCWMENSVVDDYLADLSGTSVKVYVVLMRYADNDSRVCYPGIRKIMSLTGLKSETSVRSALRALQAHGLIEVEQQHDPRGRRVQNLYHLRGMPPSVPRGDTPQPDAGSYKGKEKPQQEKDTTSSLRSDVCAVVNLSPPAPAASAQISRMSGSEEPADPWPHGQWLHEWLCNTGLPALLPHYPPGAHARIRAALLDYVWWDAVDTAVNGLNEAFLERQFAALTRWFLDHPKKKYTPRGLRKALGPWLERGKERERRQYGTAR